MIYKWKHGYKLNSNLFFIVTHGMSTDHFTVLNIQRKKLIKHKNGRNKQGNNVPHINCRQKNDLRQNVHVLQRNKK